MAVALRAAPQIDSVPVHWTSELCSAADRYAGSSLGWVDSDQTSAGCIDIDSCSATGSERSELPFDSVPVAGCLAVVVTALASVAVCLSCRSATASQCWMVDG